MMRARIRQFVTALTAEIVEHDQQFLWRHLSTAEEALFNEMAAPEQRHSLDVAYTVEKLAARPGELADKELVIRCALLHDVGKPRGSMTVLDKILTVLLDQYFPEGARRCAREGKGNFIANRRHAMHIYYHHPQYGMTKLERLGLHKLAAIIAKHHEAPAADDAPELRLLREADSLN